MIRRIKSCQSCRKRFTTASGSSLCLPCRKPDEKVSASSAVNECISSLGSGGIHNATGNAAGRTKLTTCNNSSTQLNSFDSGDIALPEKLGSHKKSLDPSFADSERFETSLQFNTNLQTKRPGDVSDSQSKNHANKKLKVCHDSKWKDGSFTGARDDMNISLGSKAVNNNSLKSCHNSVLIDSFTSDVKDNIERGEESVESDENGIHEVTFDEPTNCFDYEESYEHDELDCASNSLGIRETNLYKDDENDAKIDHAANSSHMKENNPSQLKVCGDEHNDELQLERDAKSPGFEETDLSPGEKYSDNNKSAAGLKYGSKSLDTKETGMSDNESCIGSDDDSEIICWDASESEPISSDNRKSHISECTELSNTDINSNPFSSNPCTPQVANAKSNTNQDIPTNFPRDVCYICGSDLSKLTTGIRGRVAHMKRCSAKHGNITLGNDAALDGDLIASGGELLTEQKCGISDMTVLNPYSRDEWHGDASAELEANKPPTDNGPQVNASKNQKQSALDKFFIKPVRSLTNVLMAGSRQLAKSKSIEAKKKADVASNGKPRGRWGGGGGSWSSNRNRGNCPGYKKIPGTDFICDGFHYASHTLSSNYFLTHFHSDHYGGITKKWNEGTIYCSAPTANLVNQQLGVEKRYLHPLPMNTPTVIASKDKPITVTLLDANHCPGAVMFLFEVGSKKILHVGDFRWNQQIMMAMPQLRTFSNMKPRLDEIFLDTTYCDPKYTLPTQDEAIAAAIKVVKDEMSTAMMMGTKSLLLFGSYTIGKEKIYLSVAEYLKTKVYVDKRRFRILSALEWPKERMALFTTNKSESYLWVVPLGHVNFKKMPEYLEDGNKNKPALAQPYGRVVGFRPTGWTYSAPKKASKPTNSSPSKQNLISSKASGRFSVHGVPYSEHSSFPELVDCLRCLKPKKITTTVSVSKSEEQCQMLLGAVTSE